MMSFWNKKKELKLPKHGSVKDPVSGGAGGPSPKAVTPLSSGVAKLPKTESASSVRKSSASASTGDAMNNNTVTAAASPPPLDDSTPNRRHETGSQMSPHADVSGASSSKPEAGASRSGTKSDKHLSVSRSGRYKSKPKQRARILSDDGCYDLSTNNDLSGFQNLNLGSHGNTTGHSRDSVNTDAVFSFLDSIPGDSAHDDPSVKPVPTTPRSAGSTASPGAKYSAATPRTTGSNAASNSLHNKPHGSPSSPNAGSGTIDATQL